MRFRTRKHFALLIRLALEPGRKLTRDYLIDLLWPEPPLRLASHSLAQALSVLKTKVGVDGLVIQRAAVALAETAVDVDAHHLDVCDVEIRGPFLDGLEIPRVRAFEEWKDHWRAKLMPKVRDCLVKQMDAGRRIGDFATVERHAQVLYDLDPLSEDAIRGLMEARAWVGDRSNALKAFARFEDRLAEELGAKPSGELVRMADLLRQGRRSPSRGAAGAAGGAATVSEPAEKRFEAETLVGRAAEFAALYDAWLDVRRREPRIVVLTGDPGIGKTTLTNAFASSVQMEGAVVARAQAYDAERELPFAVLGELVRQLTIQGAIGSADPEALSELSRITADIFAVFPGVPKPIEWSAEVMPLRLADACLKATTAAAEESPVVLVVDDVHAADNASAGILHMVARKIAHTRVLVILAGRSAELRIAGAPAALTADTSIQGLRQIDVEPLSQEAGAELIARLAARAVGRAGQPPSERILRVSSGNPLAIELLTKEWTEHGPDSLLRDLEALDTLPAATLGIPRAIRTVFERQVRRLDAATRAVLDLAAVLGRRLSDLALYAAVDCPAGDAAEALARLREEGLLREVHWDLEFRNELIRAQAYYAVATKVRQQLHRRVAELLAGSEGTDSESVHLEVAWHYLRGHCPQLAVAHVITGAEGALAVGAPVEAEKILRALLDSKTQAASQQLVRLRFLLAKALVDQSKGAAAVATLKPLLNDTRLDSRDLAEAWCMQAAAAYLLSHEADSHYREAAKNALDAARAAGGAELLSKALLLYAQSAHESGDNTRLREARHEIAHLLERPDAAEMALAHYASGFCHFVFQSIEASAAAVEHALRLLSKEHRLPELARAWNALGVCRLFLCQFADAEHAFEETLRLVLRLGDDSRACLALYNHCATALVRGDLERAIQLGLASVEAGEKALDSPHLGYAHMNLAEAYLLAGNTVAASRCIDAAQQVLEGKQSWQVHIWFLCDRASKALIMGNTSLVLDLSTLVELALDGKDRGGPTESSLLDKLRVFRAAHTAGPEAALELAISSAAKYRGRNPLSYLNALGPKAWAEKLVHGRPQTATISEFDQLIDTFGAYGRRAQLVAEGFLNP